MTTPYTGTERRWMGSREWQDWTNRHEQYANQDAIRHTRSADILWKKFQRYKRKDATSDALLDGYCLVKEHRDNCRRRVAKDVAPWFDGSAFRTGPCEGSLGASIGPATERICQRWL